jgi:hypothetical protein
MIQVKTELTFWQALPRLTAGVVVGALFMVGGRTLYYDAAKLQPATAPQIAFYFFPLLVFVVLIVALPLEVLLRRIFFAPQSRVQAFFVGMLHATLLSVWAFPPYWYMVIIFNPLLLRWLLSTRV